MFSALKRELRTLKHAPPGERFTRAYESRNDEDRPLWQRLVSLGIAGVVVVVGVIALPAPGPGTLVLIVGFGLVAREIAPVASALDASEVVLRRAWRRVRVMWKNAGTLGRVGMVAVAAVLVLATVGITAIASYRMIFK